MAEQKRHKDVPQGAVFGSRPLTCAHSKVYPPVIFINRRICTSPSEEK
jgi:hypothetical protein